MSKKLTLKQDNFKNLLQKFPARDIYLWNNKYCYEKSCGKYTRM